MLEVERQDKSSLNCGWKNPSAGTIKLNTAAAVRTSFSTVAVVARDAHGSLCSVWTHTVNEDDPIAAEASAILWALQIAKMENFTSIIVESNSKLCIDAITLHPEDPYWVIAAFVFDIISLSSDFSSCSFSWVKREANMAAHELAKFATLFDSVFFCSAASLPPSLPLFLRLGRGMLFAVLCLVNEFLSLPTQKQVSILNATHLSLFNVHNQFPSVFALKHVISLMKMDCVKAYWLG